MKSYRTSSWQNLRENERNLDPELAKHLREIARPHQIAFQRLMSMCDGNPVGIECKHESREIWAFVLPDVSGGAPWRIQSFDADGFFGHSCYNSLEQAVEELVSRGYYIPDRGALDHCSMTLRWAIGVKRTELREMFNQGKIGCVEMMKRMQSAVAAMQ